MKKSDKIFLVLAGLFCLIGYLFRLKKDQYIDADSTYVLGVVKEKVAMETGWNYTLEYHYDNKAYVVEFNDLRPSSDTLLLFKISRRNPTNWRVIEKFHTPGCMHFLDVPKLGWSAPPTCDSIK